VFPSERDEKLYEADVIVAVSLRHIREDDLIAFFESVKDFHLNAASKKLKSCVS
jgi:hypothetical protein